ncbi:hypothetical protein FEM33_15550 [Dyadobacter flavalbus]|uniref:Uncharacterized protein n=1 Tax=Dyadobacter flavalbus TaxID=2579942 RepID=A0A5M8QWP3_9BACT|nr:hypothetical protein [Dyadobacter flavalbus]KAA6438833.1 hypothetical protein FEM33_15550 [Dyadobacter flavalbus]
MAQLPELDIKMKSEIRSGLDRARELLDSQILWKSHQVYTQSVLIEVLVNMKDLLIKADKLGNRICFTDDIYPDINPRIKIYDVHDLICNYRDAACHNDSFRRQYGDSVFSFNTIRGKGILFRSGEFSIGSNYQDEVAYNMGMNILYLKRHIERAFIEVEAFLSPLCQFR